MVNPKVILWTSMKGVVLGFSTNRGGGGGRWQKSGNRINYGVIILLSYGSTTAVNSGQLGGNEDTFMPIFSADTLGFAVAIYAKLELETL